MTKEELRELIFNKYGGHCSYCGCKLEKGWHVDHLIPVRRDCAWNHKKKAYIPTGRYLNPEADVIENKMPSCPSCNINKHSLDLEEFRHLIQNFIKSLNRDITQYKLAKRYGLVVEQAETVTFYFESYE